VALAVLIVACKPEPTQSSLTQAPLTPTPAQTVQPPPTKAPPGRCGDGICDGPENATNCPEDCSPPAASPTPEVQPTPEMHETVTVEPGQEPDTYWVTNPTSGARLYVQVIHPQNRDGGALPTLVLVPGGSGDSSRFIRPPSQAQSMADNGFTIVVFDPDGRGRSEGIEDDNGYTQQDGLAAVIRFAATLPEVDEAQIGLVSYSYGVTMATGALARHPDLPIVFLIDWEGPANRDDTGGCDEASTGHLQGHPCDDEDFWREREASTFALHLQVPYQRLQSENDHAQPDTDHALLMIANATGEEYGGHGIAPWTRLNDLTPNTVYTTTDPPSMPPKIKGLESLIVRYAIELFDLFSTGDKATSTLPPTVRPAPILSLAPPPPSGSPGHGRVADLHHRATAMMVAGA
jgi:pimeloyl-ACP methyl ester carboxylesterase